MVHHTAFSNNQRKVLILHEELRHNVEILKHMTQEIIQPKIKTNPNFQQMSLNKPLYRISPSFINLMVKKKEGGPGGGHDNFLFLKREGLFERGA